MKLAHECLYGIGRTPDVDRAISLYKELSNHDNHEASNALGQMLMDNKFCQQDLSQVFIQSYQKAYLYYSKSAQGGNAEGMY